MAVFVKWVRVSFHIGFRQCKCFPIGFVQVGICKGCLFWPACFKLWQLCWPHTSVTQRQKGFPDVV